MFVSNHPSLEAKGGVGGCQPTSSIYWGGPAYDWLCCFANYHTEHHDFPDVPAFQPTTCSSDWPSERCA